MWRRKRLIIVAVLATVLLAGTIGGVALAADDEDSSQPDTILNRVAEILVEKGVDVTSEQLQDAFSQAQSEVQLAAMEGRLNQLVEEGVIDESQAQDYLTWWQSRPDVPVGPGFGGRGGFRGFGGMRGFGGIRGFGGPCFPPAPSE